MSTFTDDPWHIGAKVGSNNTGELSAVIEALDYLLRFQPPPLVRISLYIDLQYAVDTMMGICTPSQNLDLAVLIQLHYSMVLNRYDISIHTTESHTGIVGNERADQNANTGVTSSSFLLGRFQTMPPESLQNSYITVSSYFGDPAQTPSQNYTYIVDTLKNISSTSLQISKISKKKYISAATVAKSQELKALKFATHITRTQYIRLNKDLKKSIKKDWNQFVSDPCTLR